MANRVLAISIPFFPIRYWSSTPGPRGEMDSGPTLTPPAPGLDTPGEPQTGDSRITESYASVLWNISQSLGERMKWCPTSQQDLENAEADLLSTIKRPFKTYFVSIGPGWGLEDVKIRTLKMLSATSRISNIDEQTIDTTKVNTETPPENNSPKSTRQPLVMVHGFAAGIGTWILNLDSLSSTIDREIYAIDLVGFARSSRAPFDLAGDVEGQWIETIERWRNKEGIDKFILCGHSFGGYLCGSYAIKYPERVSHVILADPWGIQDRSQAPVRTYRFPMWVRAARHVFQAFNPLAVLRATGPYGPTLVQKLRGDLREKFRPVLEDDCDKFLTYIYHCNAQTATGESAFKTLTLPYGWPKNPLIHRLLDLDPSVPLTFIYGARSWIDKSPGEFLKECMSPNRVTVNIIENSGHHVYADKYMEFNELIKEACAKVQE